MFLGVFFSEYDLPLTRSESRTQDMRMVGPPINGNIAATVNENKLWYFDGGYWNECLQGLTVDSVSDIDHALVLLAKGLRKLHATQGSPELIEFTNFVLKGPN